VNCRFSTTQSGALRACRGHSFNLRVGTVVVVFALVCPGQGAQTPGMLIPWAKQPGARELLDAWSVAADLDLLGHGTTSDADTIRDTAVAQPLLVAAALLSATALFGSVTPPPNAVVAGHSVGEFAAAALAGVLTPEEAIRLVAVRGRAMAAAARTTPTGMSAILGGDPEQVMQRLAELDLTAANVNGAGQIVAAGTLENLAELAEQAPPRARVMKLQVAGAFHTHFMAEAIPALTTTANVLSPLDPRIQILSNTDGETVTSGRELVHRLIQQVVNPVRWDLCQATMARLGVTALVELAPGGVLKGLAKRTLKGVPSVALTNPDDLAAARELAQIEATE
jgi:[acyl-carrier-protein] S-malonyltransferase